ncbi:MAG: glycosyltransferase [Candidatus Heimdallarchaeota archaeon]
MGKILMLKHSDLPDNRADREAKALKKAEHKVFMICTRVKNKNSDDIYEKIFFVDMNVKVKFYLRKEVKKVAQKYRRVIDEIEPDIVHAHDIVRANVVRYLEKKNWLVVYDNHEVWELYKKGNLKELSLRLNF